MMVSIQHLLYDNREMDSGVKQLAVLGSTGSIGRQTLEVVRALPHQFRIVGLAAGTNSDLLAKQIMPENSSIFTDLVRIRNTQQQWDLTHPQRRRNVKGAFAVRKGHPFNEKTVLLVDDISTSGATLNECAKTLKAAGAKKVYTAVLATAFHDE